MKRLLTSSPRSALCSIIVAALACGAQAVGAGAPVASARARPASPVAQRASSTASSAVKGRAVYEYWCAPCHAAGPGHPGTQSLQIKYGGRTPAVLLERTDLAPASVALFVRQGVLSMPPFRKTEITDAELAALSAYVARNFSRH